MEYDEPEAAKAWARQALLDGMRDLIDPVPLFVEVEESPPSLSTILSLDTLWRAL